MQPNPKFTEALKGFRRSKPWRGTLTERKAKFNAAHAALCEAFHRNVELVLDVRYPEADRGNGWACRHRDRIVLTGKLSVVTLLHKWGHILFGSSEAKAIRFSIEAYEQAFPKSAAKHLTTIRPYGQHFVTRKSTH